MRNPRDDIQLKIEWADKHLCDFRQSVSEFKATHPYRFRVERDPQTREPVYYAETVDEVPAIINLLAGEVLQNLRSALDYLAYALVWRNDRTKLSRQTAFPIHDSPTKYESGYIGQVNGMHQFAIDKISAIKPYKGGDDVLWRLHRLNNVDKHRLLFTTNGNIRAMDMGRPMPRPNIADDEGFVNFMGGNWVGVPNCPFPLKKGDVIFRDVPDAELNQNVKFFGEIALNEPQVSVAEPMILVLSRSLRRVRQVVEKFVVDLMEQGE
jgi:hypothetical protein